MCLVPNGSDPQTVSIFRKTMKLSHEKYKEGEVQGGRAPRTEGLELILRVSGLPQAGDVCTEMDRALTKKKGKWGKVRVAAHFKQRAQTCQSLVWKEL